MPGDREAAVTGSNRSTSTASPIYDLALIFSDGSTQSARLGPEGVPDRLKRRDPVLVTMAANIVVSLRRP
jgi:hypothetical protein